MAKKKTKSAAGKKTRSTRPAEKKKSGGSKPKKTTKVARKKSSAAILGRPKVTGEEVLFMLFHDDYHSRQVFDFLRVHTVKELEQYTPQEIFKLLSEPISETVNRIRRRLAEKNRHLAKDADFAIEFQTSRET